MTNWSKALKLNSLSGVFTVVALIVVSTTAIAQTDAKTKHGITVTTCGFDYDDENFCSDERMKAFAKVMKTRKANFAQDRLLYIYKPDGGYGFRMVSINKNNQTVTPFYWSLSEASQVVNTKGEKLAFNFTKASNEFCFKGYIGAYRNAYDYDPQYYPEFCFDYDKNKDTFGWFKQ